jgi:putative addiction module component (TIGR02574 family)
MSSSSIEEQLLSLSESDRIHLIEVLWESLVSDDIRDRTGKWVDESERRLDAVASGDLSLVDADQVFRELRGRLGR